MSYLPRVVLTILLATSLVFSILPSSVSGDCYAAEYCGDLVTNTTYQSGDSWVTSNCYRCLCWSQKIVLKSCLQVADRTESVHFISPTMRKSALLRVIQARLQSAPVEVVVTRNESLYLVCPDVPDPVQDPITHIVTIPRLRLVNYVLEIVGMGCCATFMYPVSVHGACESVWDQGSCRYSVLDRQTGGPCLHPHGYVGK